MARSTSLVQRLPWWAFIILGGVAYFGLSEAYRRQGYRVMENSTAGADGGVDLVLIRNGKTTLVQCKRWQSNRVSVTLVREHLGVVTAAGAQHGIIVCSGGFTKSAVAFARDSGIELVDGDALIAMVSALQDPSSNHSVVRAS